MPYHTNSDLPGSLQERLPKHAQDIYREAFNSAIDQYGEESRAHRVAWSAVKSKYSKGEDDNWHRDRA